MRDAPLELRLDIDREARRLRRPGETLHDAMLRLTGGDVPSLRVVCAAPASRGPGASDRHERWRQRMLAEMAAAGVSMSVSAWQRQKKTLASAGA